MSVKGVSKALAKAEDVDLNAYPERIRKHLAVCLGRCGRMTRPTSIRKAEAPDTVARQAGGRCQQCLREVDVTALDPEARAAEPEEMDEEARRKLARTITTTSAFILERRRRIAAKQARMRRRLSA